MKKILPITDDATQFATVPNEGDPEIVDDATSMMVLWDECGKGLPLPDRYELLRVALESRWGKKVSLGTAFTVLEVAVSIITNLKKTHIVSDN